MLRESDIPETRPLVYVVSEYTAPTKALVLRNIQRAIAIGDRINRTGLAWAVVPHQMGRDMEDSLTPLEWYALTRDMMVRCDAVYASHWSASDGCLIELRLAHRMDLPVIHAVGEDLCAELRAVKARRMMP